MWETYCHLCKKENKKINNICQFLFFNYFPQSHIGKGFQFLFLLIIVEYNLIFSNQVKSNRAKRLTMKIWQIRYCMYLLRKHELSDIIIKTFIQQQKHSKLKKKKYIYIYQHWRNNDIFIQNKIILQIHSNISFVTVETYCEKEDNLKLACH